MWKTTPRVSVIVPVWNEEKRIGDLLADLSQRRDLDEVIVVDGGSEDRTRDFVEAWQGVTLAEAPRGRGVQMNAGARLATGDVFLFLHADARLPAEAVDCIRSSLAEPDVVAGAFRIETTSAEAPLWLRPLLRLADLRSRLTRLPYGDQGVFVRSESFWEVGGFPDIAIMEDLEFGRRLRAIGTIRRVPATINVSGRRFVARPFYYAMAMSLLPLFYRLGVSPLVLARFYDHPR